MTPQKKFRVKSLQLSAVNVVVDRLQDWDRLPVHYTNDEFMRLVLEFQQYCKPFHPVIPILVECDRLEYYHKLYALFLPFLVKKKLELHRINSTTQLIDLILDYGLLDQDTLRNVSELCIEVNFSYRRETLFSCLPNVKKFRIECFLDDRTIESIVKFFPELTVVDGSSDNQYMVTDYGLQMFSSLKKLKCLLLSISDGLFSVPMSFTAVGVSSLLTQMPELVKFTLPEMAMTWAFKILEYYQISLPNIKSLELNDFDMSSDIYPTINSVCPNIERLSVFVGESWIDIFSQHLAMFSKVRELRVDLGDCSGFPFDFGMVGKQLLVLHIQEFQFEPEDMVKMSEQCPNLKFLAFGGSCSDDSLTFDDCINPSWPLLFPSLESLHFRFGDLDSLYFFMHRRSNLVKIGINGFSDCTSVLTSIKRDHGIWPAVETISIDINDETKPAYYESIAQCLVEVLPSLERILVPIRQDQELTLTSSSGNSVLFCSSHSSKLFYDDPEFDCLDRC